MMARVPARGLKVNALSIALALALGPAAAQGFSRFAYALLVPGMRADLGWSLAEAGGAASANAAGYLVGALLASSVATRFGLRRVFAAGLAGTIATLVAPALASGYSAILLIRLFAGIAGATAFVAGGGIAARLPHTPERTSPLVIYFAGGGVGIALSGLVVPWVIDGADDNWRHGWIVLAGLAATCTAVALRAASFVPDDVSRSVRQSGRTIGLRATHLAYGLFGAGYVAYMTFVIALLDERGTGVAFQSLFWVVLGVTAAVASFVWRLLPAAMKGRREFALTNALTAIGVLIILPSNHVALVLTSAVIFGGSFLAVVGAVTGLARSMTPPGDWTRVIGTLTGAFALGQCTGPIVAGVLSDRPSGIEAGLLLSVALLGAAAIVAMLQQMPMPSSALEGRQEFQNLTQ
jgi:predicted MFS family arabinose efflux permease